MSDTNQRPTPETENNLFEITTRDMLGRPTGTKEYTHAEFSRSLECQRDEAREQIQMMLKHDATRLESDSIVGSCDCDTKTPEVKYHKPGCKYRLISERDEAREELCWYDKLQAMREALKEAHTALKAECEAYCHTPPQFLKAALAKLQPFLP